MWAILKHTFFCRGTNFRQVSGLLRPFLNPCPAVQQRWVSVTCCNRQCGKWHLQARGGGHTSPLPQAPPALRPAASPAAAAPHWDAIRRPGTGMGTGHRATRDRQHMTHRLCVSPWGSSLWSDEIGWGTARLPSVPVCVFLIECDTNKGPVLTPRYLVRVKQSLYSSCSGRGLVAEMAMLSLRTLCSSPSSSMGANPTLQLFCFFPCSKWL